uniref:Ovule protein n=1 Tax=Panagrellus redivivus TaxID=6233 RepID=A0A7E4W3R3_PANRE
MSKSPPAHSPMLFPQKLPKRTSCETTFKGLRHRGTSKSKQPTPRDDRHSVSFSPSSWSFTFFSQRKDE